MYSGKQIVSGVWTSFCRKISFLVKMRTIVARLNHSLSVMVLKSFRLDCRRF